jgi:hypothetical protein
MAIIPSIHQISYVYVTLKKEITLSISQYFNAIQRLTSFLPKTFCPTLSLMTAIK